MLCLIPISFLNSRSRHQYPGPLFSRLNRVWACRTDVEIPPAGAGLHWPGLSQADPFPARCGNHLFQEWFIQSAKLAFSPSPVKHSRGREKLIWKDLSLWREQEHRRWVERSRRPPMASEVLAGVWVLCQDQLAASKGSIVGQEVA